MSSLILRFFHRPSLQLPTLGMILAVQYIIGQLNSPINQMISFLQSTQDAKISLERLGEIHSKENEELLVLSIMSKSTLGK